MYEQDYIIRINNEVIKNNGEIIIKQGYKVHL